MTDISSKTSQEPSLIDLHEHTLISCQGSDATTFLQGQLTCEMRDIDACRHHLAAYCNHKGRVLATLHLFPQDEGYLLCLPPNMADLFLDHIKKYAAFSKVTFEVLNNWSVLGYSAPIAATPLPDKLLSCQMPGLPSRTLIVGPTDLLISLRKNLEQDITAANASIWDELNIAAGFAPINPETSGLFTPQMINLEKFNAVSFEKGCYVGQEIIARTQHLGTLKRHLHRAALESELQVKPGDKVTDEAGQTVGTVAEAAPNGELLAVIQDSALEKPIYFGKACLLLLKA